MVRKFLALLAAFVLLCTGGSLAAPVWPEDTVGQTVLKEYVSQVNIFLIEQGEVGINSLFEAYSGFETFGITEFPDAETPEKVEITAKLFQESINSIEVRVSELSRFPRIAAAFIQALSPDTTTRAQALQTPTDRMRQAAGAPENSFEDQPEILNGEVPYIYYAYYPNQYHDGINWIQMTVIFPLEGYWNGNGFSTGDQNSQTPDDWSGQDPDYEGSNIDDDYSHYEFFVTPTPEPDSAAAENDFR